jgi:hypothetical protein
MSWMCTIKPDSHIACRSPAALKANSHIPCRYHAVLLPRTSHFPTVPNAGRSPTGRLWTADVISHICRSHAAPVSWPWEVAFRTAYSWHGRRTAWHVWIKHGRHCVNEMGKTQSKPLAERHGRGTAWYVWICLKCAARGVLSNIYALFVKRGLKNVMNAWKEKRTNIVTKWFLI